RRVGHGREQGRAGGGMPPRSPRPRPPGAAHPFDAPGKKLPNGPRGAGVGRDRLRRMPLPKPPPPPALPGLDGPPRTARPPALALPTLESGTPTRSRPRLSREGVKSQSLAASRWSAVEFKRRPAGVASTPRATKQRKEPGKPEGGA